jgi:hypothetical protein
MSAVSRDAMSYWYSVDTWFGSVSFVRRPALSYSNVTGLSGACVIVVSREAAS